MRSKCVAVQMLPLPLVNIQAHRDRQRDSLRPVILSAPLAELELLDIQRLCYINLFRHNK